jgi:acylphosphatase
MASMHIVIAGKVQGVGFRWFARSAARRLDLKGWVRNLEDGRVEVAASGSQEPLAAFRRQLTEGPEGARVDKLDDVADADESDLDYPFAMRR